MQRTPQQTYLSERLQSARHLGWPVSVTEQKPATAAVSVPGWLFRALSHLAGRFGKPAPGRVQPGNPG